MATINDLKFAALRALGYTGSISDMTAQWLRALGATANTTPDAWLEFLRDAMGLEGQRNDLWFLWLGNQGYEQLDHISDREHAFWEDGGLDPSQNLYDYFIEDQGVYAGYYQPGALGGLDPNTSAAFGFISRVTAELSNSRLYLECDKIQPLGARASFSLDGANVAIDWDVSQARFTGNDSGFAGKVYEHVNTTQELQLNPVIFPQPSGAFIYYCDPAAPSFVAIDSEQPRNQAAPWSVTFEFFIFEAVDNFRVLVSSGSDATSDPAVQNWYVRLRGNGIGDLQIGGATTTGWQSKATGIGVLPGEWVSVVAGWDGTDFYINAGAFGKVTLPVDYLPIEASGLFGLLAAANGTGPAFGVAIKNVVIHHDIGGATEFTSFYPCQEGGGLGSADYSPQRYNGLCSDEAIHEANIVPYLREFYGSIDTLDTHQHTVKSGFFRNGDGGSVEDYEGVIRYEEDNDLPLFVGARQAGPLWFDEGKTEGLKLERSSTNRVPSSVGLLASDGWELVTGAEAIYDPAVVGADGVIGTAIHMKSGDSVIWRDLISANGGTGKLTIYARAVSGSGKAHLLGHSNNVSTPVFDLTTEWQRFEADPAAPTSPGADHFYLGDTRNLRGDATLTEYLVMAPQYESGRNLSSSYKRTPGNSGQNEKIKFQFSSREYWPASITGNFCGQLVFKLPAGMAAQGDYSKFLFVGNDANSDSLTIYRNSLPDGITTEIKRAGASTWLNNTVTVMEPDAWVDMRIRYSTVEGYFLWINGFQVRKNATQNAPFGPMDQFVINSGGGNGGGYMNMVLRAFRFYPYDLPNEVILGWPSVKTPGLTIGSSGTNYGYEEGGYGDLEPLVVDSIVVDSMFANSGSGLVTVTTADNEALFDAASIELTIDGAPANPYVLDSIIAPTPYGLYQATHADLASYLAAEEGNTHPYTIVAA